MLLTVMMSQMDHGLADHDDDTAINHCDVTTGL